MRRNPPFTPGFTHLAAGLRAFAAGMALILAGCGGGGGSSSPAHVVPPQAPVITTFLPTSGVTGTTVTLTGSAFTGATAVGFNGTAATSFAVVSDTSITAVAPSGVTSGPIAVTTPGGTATSATGFTVVPAPTITGFNPSSGGAGSTVTLTGTAFTGATAVAFNGTAATSFTVVSDTSITAVAPAGFTTGTISVTTPGGVATSSASFSFVPAPAITSFLPSSGKVGDSVIITGTHLTGATAVKFNGTAATPFAPTSDTTIAAVVPSGVTTGTISVTTPGGSATSAGSFTLVPGPGITTIAPPSGGTGTLVTINGAGFNATTAVAFTGPNGPVTTTTFTIASDTKLTVPVPASAIAGPITVTTLGGIATSPRFVVGSLATFAGVISGIGNVDNTSPTAARFYRPYSVAVDASGNMFVADRANNVIRKITTAGVVSTWAGTEDVAGNADGPGSAAQFNDPTGLAVAASGNLYVADRGNSNIRMISPTGVVSTFSGTGTSGNNNGTSGSSPAPSYFNPLAVAVDAAENVYVADSGNNSIRKIAPAAPGALPVTVTTLATGFSSPGGVAVDAAGVVYLADTGNGAIKKITSGTLTTLAPGFTSPMGIAVDTSAPVNVYVSDAGGNMISTVNSSTGVVTPFAGWGNHSGSAEGFGSQPAANTSIGTAPEFDFPTGIALGSAGNPTSGNAFVADFNNNTIRKIPITASTPPSSTLTTSTYAGKSGTPGLADGTLIGSALFSLPAGVAVDGSGHIYVADSNNNAIRELFPATPATGATTLVLTPPALKSPTGVAVDTGSGNIYVADSGNDAIQVISGNTTVTTLVAGTTFKSPYGVAVDTAGNVYVADTGNNLVKKVTLSAPGVGTATTLPGSYNQPFAVAVDSATGIIYVADTYNNAIQMVSGGASSTLAGSATGAPGFKDDVGTSALFNHPNGVTVDPATGNVYVSDSANQAVRMIATKGAAAGTVVTLAGVGTVGNLVMGILPAGLAFPHGIVLDPSLTIDGSGNSNPSGSLIISVEDAILTSPF